MAKITPIYEKSSSAKSWTPKDLLREALAAVEGEFSGSKRALLVLLEDRDGESYQHHFMAGMGNAEASVVAKILADYYAECYVHEGD